MTNYLFLLGFFAFSFLFAPVVGAAVVYEERAACRSVERINGNETYIEGAASTRMSVVHEEGKVCERVDPVNGTKIYIEETMVSTHTRVAHREGDEISIESRIERVASSSTGVVHESVVHESENVVYTGMVYENSNDEQAIFCTKEGILSAMDDGKAIQNLENCAQGEFSEIIFFEVLGKTPGGKHIVESFIPGNGQDWSEVYAIVSEGKQFRSCKESPKYAHEQQWKNSCDDGLQQYEEHKQKQQGEEQDDEPESSILDEVYGGNP